MVESTMQVLLLFCWGAVVAEVAEGMVCPDLCRCLANLDQQTITVDCSGEGLTAIPSPLPNATSHLDLSNNLIGAIGASDIWEGATEIRHLQLQNNAITSIHPDALSHLQDLETLILFNNYELGDLENTTFEGLGNLQRLVAYNTGIKKLPPGLFQPLTNVVEIDLSFSQLQCITTETFQNLTRLKTISLNNNFITSLESEAFENLPSLHYLSLNHNQISEVPPNTFSGLDNVRTITLNGNPIECSCSARYLREFLLEAGLSGPLCESPELFRRRALLSLASDEFCEQPTAVINATDFLIIPANSSLHLTCLTSGTPPPSVTWSRDGMALEEEETRVVITGATLRIASAERSDSGEYHCSATSSAGLVSSSVLVQVLGDTQPVTTMAVVREDVVLDCSSELPPRAPVRWSFNMSTLAAVSSGHAVLQNGSLLLVEVWIEDMGDYVCEVGQVQLTRTLLLTAVPEIVSVNQGRCEEPSILRVDSDVFEVLLRCVAVGIPPPTVQWLFRGMVLNTTVPPANMTGGEVEVTYIIFRPEEPFSEGNYTCTARSQAGDTSVTLFVDVRNILPPDEMPAMRQSGRVGDSILLNCPLEERELAPGFTVTWGRASAPLPRDRVRFICGNHSLVLLDSEISDVDTYSCIVLEPSGRTFRFDILLSLFECPVISRECGIPVLVRRVGDRVMLTCGTGFLTRTWRRNDMVLTTGGRIFIGGPFLTIMQAEVTDSGLYNCTISNNIGSASIITELVIQRPAAFTEVPQDSSVVLGGSVELPCAGSGSPAPLVTWWRENGTEVETNGQVFLLEESLLIVESTPWNEGCYYCNLSSAAGPPLISPTVFLDVLIPPTFVGFRESSTFKVGDVEARLQCGGSGDPQPTVTWSRQPEGTPLPSPTFTNYVQNGTDLLILSVSEVDAGVFRCTLTSPTGQTFQDTTVIVKAPPRTRVEPEGVVASVGCQVMFRCLDEDMPPLLPFQWMFNGVPVETTPPGVMVGEEGTLMLSGLRVEDSGVYACTVFDVVGATTATTTLTVEDPVFASGTPSAPPTILSPTPSTQQLSLWQDVQFVCLVEGFPRPEVVWLKDGEPLPNIRRVVVLDEALSVRDVRVSDAGLYQCTASNPLGQDTRQFSVSVTSPPFIATHPVPQSLVEGETLTLECLVGGAPDPTITWLQNGSQVLVDERHVISATPSYSRLRVLNVSVSEDAGVYSCLAENPGGRALYSVLISIQEFSAPPVVVNPPQSVEVQEGEPVIQNCDVEAEPMASVSWEQGGVPVPTCPEDLNQTVVCVPVNTPTLLMILEATAESEGRYTCVADNPVGSTRHEITLTILPPDTALPTFLTTPLPEWVGNGSDVTLDCVVGGSPPPEVTWLRNMAAVNVSGPRFQQLDNNSLVLLEVTEESAGFFTCRAENDMGSIQATVQVDVIILESVDGLSSPVVTSFPLGTLALLQGQSATLDCTASGNPPPSIVWSRNGQPLDFALFPSLSLAPNGSLLLRAVVGPEEGNYTCTATNEEGTSLVPFQLEISDGIFTGSAPDSAVRVLAGSSVLLAGPETSSELAAVLWEHEGRVLHVKEHVRVLANGSLLISSVRVEHAGLYHCMATHIRGWSHTTIQLHVKPREEPPFFTAGPQALRIVKKGFVILPCAAESPGGEDTTAHWRHAGTNITRTGTRHRVLQDGSLLLVNVRVGDGGEYVCVGRNKYGVSTTSAQLTITRSKVEEEVVAREGSTVLLVCGEGEEKRVQWLKDSSTPLSADKGRVWLHSVNHTHEGEYTCSYGKTTHNYYVTVQAAPVMTTPPMAVSLQQGEIAALHCAATGKPPPTISWHFNERQVERDHTHSILANGTLLVYETERGHDEGVYLCRANNTVGVAELKTLLFLF